MSEPSCSVAHRLLLRCATGAQVREAHASLMVTGELVSSPVAAAVFLHNTLIRAYARTGGAAHLEAILASAAALPGSAIAAAHGGAAHAQIVRLGFSGQLHATNALIHFYSLAGDLPAARRLLETSATTDVVSFNTLITGYCRSGNSAAARKLFDEMPQRNGISWTAMISGHVHCGEEREALSLFSAMQSSGVPPMAATLVSVLSACAQLGALEQGRWVHRHLRVSGGGAATINVFLGTALIDMYAKCGEVDAAVAVFEAMPERNLLSWTTLIGGLAVHGRDGDLRRGPDDVAFVAALSACSHAGLLDDGRRIFAAMRRRYGVEPKLEHYGCLVDLLARGGRLTEAMAAVEEMPVSPDGRIWSALMAGCRFHGDAKLAERVAERLVALEPDNGGVYVLLANGEGAMRRRCLGKAPGWSSVEVGGEVHQFTAGGGSHPAAAAARAKWAAVERRLREEEGYVPGREEVLVEVEEEEKDAAVGGHSEKIAMGFAMLRSGEGERMRIMKNLRVCGDCHRATKLVSKVFRREIVVRDRTRFHIFRDGRCSCGDYW
ncbi:unnamed protein product [Spirodela intermedia]|uniref:DYW domain-containing protein n=1 Tax=Spirodela intermedia TaxID=51605 RepID=A0A7I8JG97_SPIIN|nr:unnamed protein product [Spirodela intermedia]CAA6668785.1 unnamed protein product [Spirodela intermedia]